MYFKIQTNSKCHLVLVFLLALLSINVVHAQIKAKRNRFGIEIIGSVLPKAKISQDNGDYHLRSVLQSSYEVGLNNLYSINASLFLSTGFHVIVGKYNYFMDLPASDMRQYNVLNGNRFLEGKHLWQAIKIPLIITKRFRTSEHSENLVTAGITVRYSGFMTDFLHEGAFIDTLGHKIQFFEGRSSPNNDGHPWTTFMIGTGKAFYLDNKNQLMVNVILDVSLKNFFHTDYLIKMPGKTPTTGKYKFSGSGLGVSIQYIFTGENKRMIRKYEKEQR